MRSLVLAVIAAATLAAPLAIQLPTSNAATDKAARAAEQANPFVTLDGDPVVIAHRGASGYRPEHTLAAYELAARMGADFIEPDLVSTKDGVLVARHENEISGTTDVASRKEFADRKATKVIDGVRLTGWFTEDFTLAELKTLRAVERLPEVRQENTIYDGMFEVPTFEEVLQLRDRLSKELRRPIGVYPETKHPTYFDSIGLSLEEPLIAAIRKAGLDRPNAPVVVQSFETTNLRDLKKSGIKVPLVQLLSGSGAPYDLVEAGDSRTYADLITPKGLREISTYAQGIGPEKSLVIPRRADGSLGEPSQLVKNAHAAGLVVHPYTLRNENTFMPKDYRIGADPTDYGRAVDEQLAFLQAGVDGVFTDNPDTGVVARSLFLAEEAA